MDHRWVQDISGGSGIALYDFLDVWDLDTIVQLHPNAEDNHRWRFTESNQYSAKSAYVAFFNGAVNFEPWEFIWKSWVPKKYQFFLWLAAHDRCWTADTLARRGLPHPNQCPL